MDHGRIFSLAEAARGRGRLRADDVAYLRSELPDELAAFPRMKLPASVRHPRGFTVSGAPVGMFLRSAILLAGRKAFGSRYGGAPFYERVESDLAMRIMRAYFNGDAPKGAFCCKQCTLAILPVLEANAIRYFECKALAKNVRRMIHAREWRFASAPNGTMLKWSLGA